MKSLLRQNSKNLRKIFFNFLSPFGDPYDANRFLLNIPGLRKMYLPIAMRQSPLIQNLLKSRSLSTFFRSSFFKANFHSVTHFHKSLHNLRLKYDFLYWISIFYPDFYGINHAISLIRKLQVLRLSGQPIYLLIRKNELQDTTPVINLFALWWNSYSLCRNDLMFVSTQRNYKEMREFFLQWHESSQNNPLRFEKTATSFALSLPASGSKYRFVNYTKPDNCRGFNFSFLYLSDMGNWHDPKNSLSKRIITAAFPVVLNSPDSIIILESGPHKRNSTFLSEYKSALNQSSPFQSISIPWYEDPEKALKFDLHQEKIKLLETIHKYRCRRHFPHFRNVSGKLAYELFSKGIPLESINWFLAESTFFSSPSSFLRVWNPDLQASL